MTAANAMVDKGFKAAGYNYVIQDDCWSVKTGRDHTTHQILPNITKFTDGIKGIADKVHDLGFKYGIYSSAGLDTCGGYPVSLGYKEVDAATFAAWGVDYVKYDNCGVPEYWYPNCTACNPDPSYGGPVGDNGTCAAGSKQFSYGPLRDYQWPVDGTDEVWTWGNTTGQSWRMSNDILNDWESVVRIINMNSLLSNYADFGGHNDPDMLEIGNGLLTAAEDRTHFAMWALMKSPLLIGTDVTTLSQTQIEVLQNKHLLAFNQDPIYGKPAQPYRWGVNPAWTYNATNPAEFWSGASSQGTMIAMMNILNQTRTMTAEFGEIPELGDGSYQVVNVWNDKKLGCKKGSVKMTLEPHHTAVLLIKEKCS
ncbi:hypothetical protein LTR49_026492 [Elasticomyces elasticus]|nr:hypothetical protein LTR49_026492 [Elasticomyces elasticus]